MHRRLAAVTTALGCALASTVALAGPAAAGDSWPIPQPHATITIAGRGHGHGRGMSQVGADRAADAGQDY